MLCLLGLPIALMPVLVSADLWTMWMAFVGLSTLAIGLDLVLALPRRAVGLKLDTPYTLFIGARDPLRLALTIPESRGPMQIDALLEVGELLRRLPPVAISIPGGEVPTEVELILEPWRRAPRRCTPSGCGGRAPGSRGARVDPRDQAIHRARHSGGEGCGCSRAASSSQGSRRRCVGDGSSSRRCASIARASIIAPWTGRHRPATASCWCGSSGRSAPSTPSTPATCLLPQRW